MSTPAPIAQANLPWHIHWSAHIKHIVVAVIVAAVLWFAIFKFTSVWEEIAKSRQTQAEQALKTAQDQLKQMSADRAASDQKYADTVGQVLRQNAALAQQVTARDHALQVSQQALQTMPLDSVAAEW